MLYFMAAALPAMLLINASNAEAQRKNHTRADVTAAGMQESEKMMNNDMGCQCAEMSDASCKCGKMSKKDMKKKHKKHHDRLQKEMKEINEEYDEAIEMIDKSSFSEANQLNAPEFIAKFGAFQRGNSTSWLRFSSHQSDGGCVFSAEGGEPY